MQSTIDNHDISFGELRPLSLELYEFGINAMDNRLELLLEMQSTQNTTLLKI